MSLLLRLYLLFSRISGPLWRLSHRKRLRKGKEIAERLPEKYGDYTQARPEGTVLWFHALSVGESLALVALIEKTLTERPEANVVLTTSTATSVAALEKAGLPNRCTHVLLPIDTPAAVGRFLDHWRPQVAAFAELDFWPCLMVETNRRNIPMILINTRMPKGNFERRQKIAGPMRDILGLFERLLVQDEASVPRLASFGVDPKRMVVAGALKSAARPLPADETELSRLRSAIGDRPVWLAAATIAAEHEDIISAHASVAKAMPDALMVFAPRNLSDGDSAEALARAQFSDVARRSKAEPLRSDTQVYLADTIGEMGLWYRLAPVSFLGHSLHSGLEGKNPFEAAALGSAILYGPNVNYFAESYALLAEEQGAQQICNAEELAETVLALLTDPDACRRMTVGATRAVEKRREVLETTWNVIAGYL